MTKKKRVSDGMTAEETQFVERLREHPEIMARFQSILEISRNAEGPLKTADEVEELLIRETRRLGNATMNQWALRAQARVVKELKEADGTVRCRKKKR